MSHSRAAWVIGRLCRPVALAHSNWRGLNGPHHVVWQQKRGDVTDLNGLPSSRTSEVVFRRNAPRKLGDFEILHIDGYCAGDHASYASAIVVTCRGETGDFCTHRLIWAHSDPDHEWLVEHGYYDFTSFDAAMDCARQRAERQTKARA